jgi:hypothetical protein
MARGVKVTVWYGSDTNTAFIDPAVDVIKNDLDNQISNATINAIDGIGYGPIDITSGNFDHASDEFRSKVYNEIGAPADDEIHVLLIDRPNFIYWNAGLTEGGSIKDGNSLNEWNSEACSCLVNVAVKAYDNQINQCYGGNGSKTFEITVMHEVMHALVDSDYDDYPNELCNQSNGIDEEHSLGTVYTGRSGNPVSPLQMWYTSGACSGNNPPCLNCTGTEDTNAYDSTYDLTYCEKDRIETNMDRIF